MEDINKREKRMDVVVQSSSNQLSTSLFKAVLNQSYIKRLIFNHVSSIHKQLEITTVKVSSLYTLIDYIRYDQLWSLMFTDGRYRVDHSLRLTKIITTAIDYHNDSVLEYLLKRIKTDIKENLAPDQTMVIVNYDHNGSLKVESKDIKCLSSKVFNLLIEDNVFILSKVLLHRMVKTAILVIGDIDVIKLKKYNLKDIQNLIKVWCLEISQKSGDDLLKKKTESFANSLASGSQEAVSSFFKSAHQDNYFQINTDGIKSIDPVFCSRHYIKLLSKYVDPVGGSLTNIIRSTLQQSAKGQEYEEIDYVLKSKFCQKLKLDIADSIASIFDITSGDGHELLVERLIKYAKEFPKKYSFIYVSVRVFEVFSKPFIEFDENYDKWILHPALIEKMSHLPNSCLKYLDHFYFYLSSAAMTINMKLFKKISKTLPTEKQSDLIYYATELTDEQLHRLNQQDQLDSYQYIKYPMNPPPLKTEYIGICNQCLQNYYFQNKDNNNNNRIVKNYTQKEYEDFINQAIEIVYTAGESNMLGIFSFKTFKSTSII
ncbi:hypothetical protein DFA_10304 [Cavenderia fasciculata]|uniref:Uncharacterized protein n=1 Tax=Cavenderia fasciculata TaxID=261658 RepID=F4Q9U6_CACFS|nr:uncharacterized protein DFA_10304 [Cavenderia fasciculata]EGG15465.1 hypothetical protein DFA_10304 [Cavenderia fasciculata]|eukprot:XP_004354207.1 hypothetical protein DFA_10304 [Cavenderia fasciculata]